jgi:CheY-like chemotaxis protein
MTLQALLVSTDDSATAVLVRVLPGLGVGLDRVCDFATAKTRLEQQKFELLIVDFDDPRLAEEVLQHARKLGSDALSVALIADRSKVRTALTGGAHFVLHKPASDDAVRSGLRAAVALLTRERRRAFRVPVQAPVQLTMPDTREVDGILLDLSETGMDVLTPEPQMPGALLAFHFRSPDGAVEIEAHGQVAWANPNGQTGVHFIDLGETRSTLKAWLESVVSKTTADDAETVGQCKLTDLSLGGCYVETNSPFPERALIDLCLKTDGMEVHTEGLVRVAHPGHGMGVEFPSRTPLQRAQVGNLIQSLRGCPTATPELMISPRSLVADLTQFQADKPTSEELEDSLLELLRRGATVQQDDFLAELQHQRGPAEVPAS